MIKRRMLNGRLSLCGMLICRQSYFRVVISMIHRRILAAHYWDFSSDMFIVWTSIWDYSVMDMSCSVLSLRWRQVRKVMVMYWYEILKDQIIFEMLFSINIHKIWLWYFMLDSDLYSTLVSDCNYSRYHKQQRNKMPSYFLEFCDLNKYTLAKVWGYLKVFLSDETPDCPSIYKVTQLWCESCGRYGRHNLISLCSSVIEYYNTQPRRIQHTQPLLTIYEIVMAVWFRLSVHIIIGFCNHQIPKLHYATLYFGNGVTHVDKPYSPCHELIHGAIYWKNPNTSTSLSLSLCEKFALPLKRWIPNWIVELLRFEFYRQSTSF